MESHRVLRYAIVPLSFLLFLGLYSIEGRLEDPAAVKRSPVKTIRTQYGDKYDCVGLYEQPAFQHRLLKNHKIQMRPSYNANPTGNGTSDNSIDVVLTDSCPAGTVPIRRRSAEELSRARALFRQQFRSFDKSTKNIPGFAYAGLATRYEATTVYYGAGGMVSINNPAVTSGQLSASVISLEGGSPDQYSIIRVGWMVNVDLYHDNNTRLYTVWGQVKSGQMTGCYNTDCPGFVQTDPSIALDMPLGPISIVRGPQYYIKLSVAQEKSTGNWWLKYGDDEKPVGYWPSSLFASLVNGAPALRWGGMVASTTGQLPAMGNGDNGEIHSAHFRQLVLQYDAGTSLNGSIAVTLDVQQTKCYKSGNNFYKGEFWGYSFYFGGDGGDATLCS
ncbi:hypothetical protein like AT4G23365 [Hibiscus trionum]|uniref:Neprosin PEP catalytic domain-containing protein n=1 Tax=Hibiscus trionum TaxID=183268 RepID=A0A9W7J509_HIBTR|nr:hypothetical protein like AT4G23365 [Hibiscus trionum]